MGAFYQLVNSQGTVCQFNGQILADTTDDLNQFLEQHELNLIDDYIYDDFTDVLALQEELHVNLANEAQSDWFEITEGLNWIDSFVQALRSNPDSVVNQNRVLESLQDLKTQLIELQTQQLGWRLEIKFTDDEPIGG